MNSNNPIASIEAKRHVEDNVFITYFQGEDVIGRLFMTAHPSIPYEVFAYNDSSENKIDSKRVQTEEEAATFVAQFQTA